VRLAIHTPRGTHLPKILGGCLPVPLLQDVEDVRAAQLDPNTSRESAPPPAWLDAVPDTGPGGRSALVVLPICSIVEPAADDQTHELRLQMEAQSGVKVLGVVRLESDVLAGHGAHEVSDHCCRDATPADG
jgi:hypothetical protein